MTDHDPELRRSHPLRQDHPVGTVVEHHWTAQPYPLASETVRKRYPDGTVRQWTRPRGDQPWQVEDLTLPAAPPFAADLVADSAPHLAVDADSVIARHVRRTQAENDELLGRTPPED